MKERIGWIDQLRGLLVIFMVLGHSSAPLTSYIYTFHVPSFFILSGILTSLEKHAPLRIIYKKLITIFLPYVFLNTIFFGIQWVLKRSSYYSLFYNGAPSSTLQNIISFLRTLTYRSDLGGPTWFLLVLFEAQIIVVSVRFLFSKLKLEEDFAIISLGIIGSLGWFLSKSKLNLPFEIDLGMHACLYFALGWFIQKYEILESRIHALSFLTISILTMVFFGHFYSQSINSVFMNWPTRSFPPLLPEVLSVFAGFYLCYSAIKRITIFIPGLLHLSTVGKRSFSILVWHFLFFRIVTLFLVLLKFLPTQMLLNTVPLGLGSYWWLFFTISSILLSLLLSKFSDRIGVLNYLINAVPWQRKDG